MEDRSTGGLALPAVPPATVREPRTDSHRAGLRWNCKPKISNAEQTDGLRRTQISDLLDSGFLRVYAEEDVNMGIQSTTPQVTKFDCTAGYSTFDHYLQK